MSTCLRAQLSCLLGFLLMSPNAAAKEVAQNPADEPYSTSYGAGEKDRQGNFMGGTETMNLVAYKGKLYAGIGYWTDQPKIIANSNDPKSGAQILVLDSKNSKWRQEFAFSLNYHRLSSMKMLKFHDYDASGKATKVVSEMLVVTLDSPCGAVFAQVEPGVWIDTHLPTDSPIRSIEVHYDPIDNVDKIFAGTGGGTDRNLERGIFTGLFDQSAPGKIKWNPSPEPFNLNSRIMSMVVCDGILYAAAKPSVLRRDDKTKQWEIIYSHSPNSSFDQTKYTSGFRGLTCIEGAQEHPDILSCFEGTAGDICRINPKTGESQIELRTRKFLTEHWGAPPKTNDIIAGYNDILCVRNNQEQRYIFGLLSRSPRPEEQNSAWLLSRTTGLSPQYTLHEVKALKFTKPRSDENLWSVRTLAVSPFAEDHGEVVYMGGYDGHFKPNHNTAWIYRAGLNTVLQAYKN